MKRITLQLLVLTITALGVAAPGHALTVNPIDPSFPLDVHAFTSCNFVATDGDAATASCSNGNVAQDPLTLNQIVGTGEATTDLRTGILQARGEAQAYWFGPTHLNANAGAMAQMYDTITVEGGYVGTIEVRMAVSGAFFDTPGSNVTGSSAQALLFGVADDGEPTDSVFIDAEAFSNGDGAFTNGVQIFGAGGGSTNANAQGQFESDDVQLLLSLFFLVSPQSPTFSFSARLNAGGVLASNFQSSLDATRTSEVDFGNTAHLSIIAPQGVSWTSASGAFLVPEPSLIGLALLPFAILGVGRSASGAWSGRCARGGRSGRAR